MHVRTVARRIAERPASRKQGATTVRPDSVFLSATGLSCACSLRALFCGGFRRGISLSPSHAARALRAESSTRRWSAATTPTAAAGATRSAGTAGATERRGRATGVWRLRGAFLRRSTARRPHDQDASNDTNEGHPREKHDGRPQQAPLPVYGHITPSPQDQENLVTCSLLTGYRAAIAP